MPLPLCSEQADFDDGNSRTLSDALKHAVAPSVRFYGRDCNIPLTKV